MFVIEKRVLEPIEAGGNIVTSQVIVSKGVIEQTVKAIKDRHGARLVSYAIRPYKLEVN